MGAWLVMQAADVFFPGWGIPDTGMNVLLVAAIVGFPLALVFGWLFNITSHGIRRSVFIDPEGAGEARPLEGNDYLVLGVLVLIAGVIVYFAANRIVTLPRSDATSIAAHIDPASIEKLPNSIAVLPFDNISTDPANEVFSDGVSEEIRNRLGQHAELHVIARTSSLQFKDSDYGLSRISDLLGVRYLVKGSVRTQGARIRVSAQLVADKGTQLWTKNYDRVLEDIFAIQDEIADLVATEVAPQIVASIGGGYKPSLDAYKHFVAGRELLYRRNVPSAEKELALAIELDPDYAQAHAEYAISLLVGLPDSQAIRKAAEAIDTALDRDPNLARALAARGLYFNTQSPPEPTAAEHALREALRKDANMVDAMNWLGAALHLQGRKDEADEWMERAYAVDPFNTAVAVNMAHRYRSEGNADRAESTLRRLTELPEPPLYAFAALCDFHVDNGRLIEATRTSKRLLLEYRRVKYFLIRSYALLGLFESSDYWMERAIQSPELKKSIWVRAGFFQAMSLHWKGEYAQAASAMHKALAASEVSLDDVDPRFSYLLGTNQALAGDFPGAILTLSTALARDGKEAELFPIDQLTGLNPNQALAWAYSQSGKSDRAFQLLETQERWFVDHGESVERVETRVLYEAALGALLMGEEELALERMEQAVQAGWREYYIKRDDPRWGALKNDPRFEALMAVVKADVDRQRAEVERIETEQDFPALVDRIGQSEKVAADSVAGER